MIQSKGNDMLINFFITHKGIQLLMTLDADGYVIVSSSWEEFSLADRKEVVSSIQKKLSQQLFTNDLFRDLE
jgi:hypothetical protein